jgi:acyl-CoA synthetase (NDP forming)
MDLQRLFYPESVAVVGASPHLGGGKMPYYQLLQMAGYRGRVYPVNPKYDDIGGVRVYPSLDDIPESVDLAIAAVPAGKALETVEARVGREYGSCTSSRPVFPRSGTRSSKRPWSRRPAKAAQG